MKEVTKNETPITIKVGSKWTLISNKITAKKIHYLKAKLKIKKGIEE